MASAPITSWQIDGKTMVTVTDFIFLGSKITVDGDCSHEIKRHLLSGRKAITNLDSVLKSKGITLLTKICIVKVMVFPSVMFGCESWTIKEAECWRIDAFKLWCCQRFLTVPWTARRSNQSILKEISPEYSLEGLMMKLKLQYFGHLMRRAYSLERTVMLGKIEGRRRKGTTEDELLGWHPWLNGHEVKSLSCVRLFVTPWTVAYQASLSMGFSRQEYWSGLPFPSRGDLPDPGIEPRSPSL